MTDIVNKPQYIILQAQTPNPIEILSVHLVGFILGSCRICEKCPQSVRTCADLYGDRDMTQKM